MSLNKLKSAIYLFYTHCELFTQINVSKQGFHFQHQKYMKCPFSDKIDTNTDFDLVKPYTVLEKCISHCLKINTILNFRDEKGKNTYFSLSWFKTT